MDKSITEIIFEIQNSTYYQFSEANGTWNKGEIEGPLFLVKRSQEPHHSLIIFNKNPHNSFFQHITSDTLFEKKHHQLLCIRDKNKNVHGIWSGSTDLIEHLYKKLQDIQHIDSQSKMIKTLLDIGGESSLSSNKSPESILETRPLEFKPQFNAEEILKPDFFQRGVIFEEKIENNFEREKVKDILVALSNSDEFLDFIVQAIRAKGVAMG